MSKLLSSLAVASGKTVQTVPSGMPLVHWPSPVSVVLKFGSDMPQNNSISLWIQAVRAGNEDAVNELWQRYFVQLMNVARSRMATLPRAAYDEEDAAISTFRVLCHQLREGNYPDLADRDEFWRLMLKVLLRKVNRRVDYETAEKRRLSSAQSSEHSDAVSPENHVESIMVADECQHLLIRLKDPGLEQVVILKLEGFSNEEIAAKLNRTRRTVHRMMTLIQNVWLQDEDTDET